MSKNLTIRDEVFPYPEEGENNYGEAATDWAESVTDVLSDVTGAGDIGTTEVSPLNGTSDGTYTTGTITNFKYDTNFVQSIEASGFITRTYDDDSFIVENFTMNGVVNGTAVDFTVSFSGTDTNFDFTETAGQFGFSYLDDDGAIGKDTASVSIKFKSNVIIDEDFFA